MHFALTYFFHFRLNFAQLVCCFPELYFDSHLCALDVSISREQIEVGKPFLGMTNELRSDERCHTLGCDSLTM